MRPDTLIAGVLLLTVSYYLVQRNLTHMIAWVFLIALIGTYCCHLSDTLSVILGLVGVYLICMISARNYENFESKEKEKDPEAAPAKEAAHRDEPHVDVGTTILHAYRNLSPEQIGGMRRDTKELMGLQKELMGSLSEMKPAIEQGAELLKTFSTFFGKPGSEAPTA